MIPDIEGVLSMLEAYNPLFVGVGSSDRASIPLGNGELCANAWVEADGLHFYLARTDAISELDRTLKLGEYVLNVHPYPFSDASNVRQELKLREGLLQITAGHAARKVEISFFIAANENDAIVDIRANHEIRVKVSHHNWRTERNFSRDAVGMFWGDEDPESLPELASIYETPDELEQLGETLVSYHVNRQSIVHGLAQLHELDEVSSQIPDLILGRTFGAQLSVQPNPKVVQFNAIEAKANRVTVRVSTFSSQQLDLEQQLHQLDLAKSIEISSTETIDFWNRYWSRSWIYVSGDTPESAAFTSEVKAVSSSNGLPRLELGGESAITRGYVLTKWMTACGSRGSMPILYNGALFTTMPGAGSHLRLDSFGKAFTAEPHARPTLQLNPDERSWTVENLWQNLRLPYFSMLARDEPEGLKPMFAYYRRFWDLNKARARLHYGARGQWNTEMTLSCGLQSPGIYGIERTGLPRGWTRNRWGGAINLSPGLELCKLMFDYWRFTKDDDFLKSEAIPYALDLIDFAISKYFDEETGRIEFRNLNSLETYFDCLNPAAIVAGYRRLASDMVGLPDALFDRKPSVFAFIATLPSLPTAVGPDGAVFLTPADRYVETRMNVESPELYAIYPFDLHADVSHDVARSTWTQANQISGAYRPAVLGEKLGSPSFSGWQYHGPVAAKLGLVNECLEILSQNVSLTNPGFAFPAMWGPIYDSVPDVDHGANILNTLQELILRICEVPELASALPRDIQIDFRLYDAFGAPLEGKISQSKLSLV